MRVCVCIWSIVGKLYAVGGHDGNEHLKSGEVFDPVANKWQSIAPMSKLRSLSLSLSLFQSAHCSLVASCQVHIRAFHLVSEAD